MNIENKRFRIWEISLMLALCVTLCLGTWAQARQESISGSLVRLHVLAVSDDSNEQRIKLNVRDSVLSYISPKLEDAESPDEAKRIISSELDGIKSAAETAAEGRPVKVTLTQEYYPTRDYGSFSLPAGRYESLRVILGEGEGHNWWCIVFPPVCLSAVQSEQVEEAMSVEDYALITRQDGYELRFRTVELWGELLEKLEENGWIAAGDE